MTTPTPWPPDPDPQPDVAILVGPAGSGKTEFALHYALERSQAHGSAVLVDADIIKPYFRSREQTAAFGALGVRVIGGSLPVDTTIEAPAVSGQVAAVLRNREWPVVIDPGGGIGGGLLLRQWEELFPPRTSIWMVLNTARLETRTVDDALAWMQSWEISFPPWRISGIVHTTHWLHETEPETLAEADTLAQETARRSQLPILYLGGLPKVLAKTPASVAGRRLPYSFYSRPDPW